MRSRRRFPARGSQNSFLRISCVLDEVSASDTNSDNDTGTTARSHAEIGQERIDLRAKKKPQEISARSSQAFAGATWGHASRVTRAAHASTPCCFSSQPERATPRRSELFDRSASRPCREGSAARPSSVLRYVGQGRVACSIGDDELRGEPFAGPTWGDASRVTLSAHAPTRCWLLRKPERATLRRCSSDGAPGPTWG